MLGDFHTHSTLDDGKSPLADMARAAWEKGITYFGFSGHSFDENGQDFCLSRANVPVYLETARALQAEYRGRMEILVGLELDYFGEKPQGLDYVIGSVHGIPLGNETFYVDEGAQRSRRAVEEHFHGDWYAMTRAYYDLVPTCPERQAATSSATLIWSPSSTSRTPPSMRRTPAIWAPPWRPWSTWSSRGCSLRSTPGPLPGATVPSLTRP